MYALWISFVHRETLGMDKKLHEDSRDFPNGFGMIHGGFVGDSQGVEGESREIHNDS